MLFNISTGFFNSPLSILKISFENLNYFNLKYIFYVIFKKDVKNKEITISNLYFKNKILDFCVVLFYKSPNTFTGENLLEIILHGNNIKKVKFILFKIKYLLNKFNLRFSKKGEFSFIAYKNNKTNLLSLKKNFYNYNFNFNLFNLKLKYKFKRLYFTINNYKNLFLIYKNFKKNYFNINFKLFYFINFINILIKFFKISKNKNIYIYILGFSNTGKSNFINNILKKKIFLISKIKGSTNSINYKSVKFFDKKLYINDTVGFYNNYNLIEKYSVKNFFKKIKFSNILILIFDKLNFFNCYFYKIKYKFKFNFILIFNKIDLYFFKNPSFEITLYFYLKKIFKISNKLKIGLSLFINEFKSFLFHYNNFLKENFYNIKILNKLKFNLISIIFYKKLDNFFLNNIYILKKNISLIFCEKKNKVNSFFFKNFCLGK